MKDLDFDELDRAVNSLMTNVPKTASSSGDDNEKTLDITPTLKEGSQPAFDKVEQAATAAADGVASTPAASSTALPVRSAMPTAAAPRPQSSSVSLPAARRAGRFMDVVHPSSDMKKPEPTSPVSRQGSTIEPLKSSTISEILPSKQEAPKMPLTSMDQSENAEIPKEKPMSEPVQESSTSSSDWPDPLDIASAKSSEKQKDETPALESPEEIAAGVEPEETPAPLTSPFLPDTKVEKRPLGAPALETPVEEPDQAPVLPEEEREPKTVDNPNDQLPANPAEVEALLPEELQGDLMAVEADTTHEQLKQAHEAKVGAEPPKKAEKATDESSSEPMPNKPVEKPAVPSGPTSIPQQYREEPSTGDQDNGAIYDTDSYHQPLAHPAKKKSGWMWVIWIVVILLLGAGGGAAMYFLGFV